MTQQKRLEPPLCHISGDVEKLLRKQDIKQKIKLTEIYPRHQRLIFI